MDKPKITIVTVTYNAEKTLEQTILSVINQTYDNIEYIIIDGASTDKTLDIIKKYESKVTLWKSEPDKGIYDAMNKGIMLATGDWINFMNAGDTYHNNDVLKEFVPKIDSNSIITYGDVNIILQHTSLIKKALDLKYLKKGMCFCHQSAFVKTIYQKEHTFDISYKIVADYSMFYRAYFEESVSFQYIPILISDYDAMDGLSSTNNLLLSRENARVQGIDGTLKWKLQYCFLRVKQVIKTLVPKRLLDARRQRKIKEMQRQCAA